MFISIWVSLLTLCLVSGDLWNFKKLQELDSRVLKNVGVISNCKARHQDRNARRQKETAIKDTLVGATYVS